MTGKKPFDWLLKPICAVSCSMSRRNMMANVGNNLNQPGLPCFSFEKIQQNVTSGFLFSVEHSGNTFSGLVFFISIHTLRVRVQI